MQNKTMQNRRIKILNRPGSLAGLTALKSSKCCLMALAVGAVAAGGAKAAWTENFDSYANGSTIIGQGAWVGWAQTGTLDTIVTNALSNSSPNSLQMGGVTEIDLVPQFSGASVGTWILNVMTYVPGGSDTEFVDIGFLARHDGFQGAPDSQWFGPLKLDMANDNVNGNAAVPLIRDQWVPAQAVFDIDLQTWEVFYNGDSAANGSFAGNDQAIVGFDVYSPGDASTAYLDDFSFVPEPSAPALFGLGGVCLLMGRRRRRPAR